MSGGGTCPRRATGNRPQARPARRIRHFEARQRQRGRAGEPQHLGGTVSAADLIKRPALDDGVLLGDLEAVREAQRYATFAIGATVRKMPLCCVSAVMTAQNPAMSRLLAKPSPSALTSSPWAVTLSAAARFWTVADCGDPLPEIAHQIDADDGSDRQRGDDVADASHDQNRKLLRRQGTSAPPGGSRRHSRIRSQPRSPIQAPRTTMSRALQPMTFQ